jgi:hypothetical protein
MTLREQLSAAYDTHVRLHGRISAVKAVQAATGQLFASEVPDDKIAATVAALTGATGTARASAGTPFRGLHAKLAAIAAKAYARGA